MRSVGPGEELYPATKGDVAVIHGCLRPDGTVFAQKSYLWAALTVVDVPISLITDTALLPVDLLRRHGIRKERAQRERMGISTDVPTAEQIKEP